MSRKRSEKVGQAFVRFQEILFSGAGWGNSSASLSLSPRFPLAAQNEIAGVGMGISDDLISLEVASPEVPDLTLIDLPGIARVAVKGQPENIGEQVSATK